MEVANMDVLSSPSPKTMSSNARIRRVNSWGSPGVSLEGKLQRVNSSEKLTAEQQKILQSIHTQQHQKQKEADELVKRQYQKQKEADELVEKQAYKESLFRNHPDILRFIRKKVPDPKTPNKHKEIIIRYHGSYDEDIDSDDEELYLVPDKSKWFGMCSAEWGMEPEDNLVSKVKAEENYFKTFTAGYCSEGGDSGCGAIIRDHWHRPIVASSKVISEGERVSQFCLELEGVALGIKLAKKYGVVFPFYLYCPSEKVAILVQGIMHEDRSCYCSGKREILDGGRSCGVCRKPWMISKDHEDYDKASEIIENIISGISDLKSTGLPWFIVDYGGYCYGGSERNEGAYFLAKLRKDVELKLKDIGALKDLWDTIYEEVFGQYVRLEELES